MVKLKVGKPRRGRGGGVGADNLLVLFNLTEQTIILREVQQLPK